MNFEDSPSQKVLPTNVTALLLNPQMLAINMRLQLIPMEKLLPTIFIRTIILPLSMHASHMALILQQIREDFLTHFADFLLSTMDFLDVNGSSTGAVEMLVTFRAFVWFDPTMRGHVGDVVFHRLSTHLTDP
jgi:hypothetical protein